MATFEKITASTLRKNILGCRGMADHFYDKKYTAGLKKIDQQEAQERYSYWLSKMNVYVDLAMELFNIEEKVSCSDDRTVLEELEKIIG